ncbi:MAG: hypothetical protein LBR92_01250 [Puniceicoccales bacterium]|nr:hypothetical protein [Puniceicoccales bacterium]
MPIATKCLYFIRVFRDIFYIVISLRPEYFSRVGGVFRWRVGVDAGIASFESIKIFGEDGQGSGSSEDSEDSIFDIYGGIGRYTWGSFVVTYGEGINGFKFSIIREEGGEGRSWDLVRGDRGDRGVSGPAGGEGGGSEVKGGDIRGRGEGDRGRGEDIGDGEVKGIGEGDRGLGDGVKRGGGFIGEGRGRGGEERGGRRG